MTDASDSSLGANGVCACVRVRVGAWICGSVAVLAIETGIALPFVLFMVGADGLAGEFVFVMVLTCMISQIPKRFVWRHRPFMTNRALCIRRDLTSSFPSRAVTCGVVYGYLICYAIVYSVDQEVQLASWMPVFLGVMMLVSAYSRVQYGCHYPSDCAVGAFQGLLVCALATTLYKYDVIGCTSCIYNECYAFDPAHAITWTSFKGAGWQLFAAVCVISGLILILSVIPPVHFWGKCHHVYGMLFPCIAFQLAFLCKTHNSLEFSLPYPGTPPWWAPIVAVLAAVIATVVGIKGRTARFSIIAYTCLYLGMFWLLVLTRLAFSEPFPLA